MNAKFATPEQLVSLWTEIAQEHEMFGPIILEGQTRLTKVSPAEIVLTGHRAVEPLKAVFFPAREDLGGYFGPEREISVPRRAIIGVSHCDLSALQVLDHVFLGGDFRDPHYEAARENTVLISQDCAFPQDVCFCTFVGGHPYPNTGYDLNLSPLEEGHAIEAGSGTGEELLARMTGFPDATPEQLEQRQAARDSIEQRVRVMAEERGLDDASGLEKAVDESEGAPIWEQRAEHCVECGACSFICPGCHCFVLADNEEAGQFKRLKNWDTCQFPAFARVAAGANPRGRRAERMRNCFVKKYSFVQKEMSRPACVGCGRCIVACAGKLDVREVLKELSHA